MGGGRMGGRGDVAPLRPGHTPAFLLRSPASPFAEAKGDGVGSRLRGNDGGRRRNDGGG